MSRIKNKPVLILFLLLAPFALGLSVAHLTKTILTEDYQFEKFADELFENEVQSNTLNLHYTLADPDSYGIHNYPLTLGTVSLETFEESSILAGDLLKKLQDFEYEALSSDNRILYDSLCYILKTEEKASAYALLQEPLSPALGIQAQLPVLLAEYTFRTEKDVQDYLALIEDLPSYFEEIISFEQEKSSAGCFMNSKTADGIIAQCNDFTADQESHFLISAFEDKIKQCTFLSEEDRESYCLEHRDALETYCFPAYEMLAEELLALRNTGINDYGLCYFPSGQDYYSYLIESTTGIYDSVELLEERLYSQLHQDYMQIQRLLTAYPNIPELAEEALKALSISSNPESILLDLQHQMRYEFPAPKSVEYDVKYVDDALKDHLSPAFYLTPPVDTKTPNSIYLNLGSDLTGVTLYTTLAHEGFPGHLYQTQYFAQNQAHPILSLFANGGYVEGWATYIESYAYRYAPVSYEVAEYLALNRSFHLCLYSVLDIGIHYHGWKPERANQLLEAIGITDEMSQNDIYQTLLEDPANYLKYCAGAIYLKDLQENMKKMWGNEFDISTFHENVLNIGPVPFPVLAKYLYQIRESARLTGAG